MSQFFVGATGGGVVPPDVPTSFVTDQGTAEPDANILNINAGQATNVSGATVFFTGNLNTVQLNMSDDNGNTFVGKESGFVNLGVNNTAFGFASLHDIDFAVSNTAIGFSSLLSLTSGFGNVAVGDSAGDSLITGSYNTLIGLNAGLAYTGSQSNNVIIGPTLGVSGDSNTTRIGSSGNVTTKSTTVFVYGVFNKTVAPATTQLVTADSTGLIGSLANGTTGQILTATTGGAPSWQSPSTVAVNYTLVSFADSPYTVLPTDYYIAVNCFAGPVTINLPDSPTVNQQFIIKDTFGHAGTNNITVKSLSGVTRVDGQPSNVFTDNYESLECLFHNANYEIF